MDSESVQSKNWLTALLLCIFAGCFGFHRFYVGKIGTGILWFLTVGCFGIGAFVDFIKIVTDSFTDASGNILTKNDSGTSAPDKVQPAANPYESLERIAKLHEQGLLSDEEFYKMKNDLMGRI